MYFTTLSVWQYSVNLAIDNIFTPSKIRIVVKGKQYGKHQRKHPLNSEIFRGFCNCHKHTKNSIFCMYIYTTKKCTEKVYISVHFLTILDHQKPGSVPSVFRGHYGDQSRRNFCHQFHGWFHFKDSHSDLWESERKSEIHLLSFIASYH